MESAGPGSDLTFDYVSGEDEFPHLKFFWRNVRKGGPKEKRLRKVISMIPDTRKEEMSAIRLENVCVYTPSSDLYDEFSKFGEIGDFFRPTNNTSLLPTPYCFIRYLESAPAAVATKEMEDKAFGGYSNGGIWNETKIKVKKAEQHHFFTQDTGYITNEALDSVVVTEKHFDPSLPTNHYAVKRADSIRNSDEVFTLKVSDIPEEITPEMMQDLFGSYGEVASIYNPMDLKTRTFRNFAFVRYISKIAAVRAWEELDNVNLGIGRNIRVSQSFAPQYFGMDEST